MPPPLPRDRGIVTVAVTSVDGLGSAELTALTVRLPDPERSRAARLGVEAARGRFVVGRVLLREMVGRATGCPAAALRIEVEDAGRPVVVGTPLPIFVSLAHSGRYVVVAVATRPVGVDVEELRPIGVRSGVRAELSARVCSVQESRVLARLPDAQRDRAFMAIWARKEAYGKATGGGLDFPLRAVTAGPSGSRLVGVAGRWRVADLKIDPEYAAAVVAAGRRWRPDLQRIDRLAL